MEATQQVGGSDHRSVDLPTPSLDTVPVGGISVPVVGITDPVDRSSDAVARVSAAVGDFATPSLR